jgi:hypothetical protein
MSTVLDLSKDAAALVIENVPIPQCPDRKGPVTTLRMNHVRPFEWPLRYRSSYNVDQIRSLPLPIPPAVAYAELHKIVTKPNSERGTPPVRLLPEDGANSKTFIDDCLAKTSDVPCPWPNDIGALLRHEPKSVHTVGFTFGLAKPYTTLNELYDMKTVSGILRDDGKPMETIAFKVTDDVIRKMISPDVISHERWTNKHLAHILPALIHTSKIDSSLPGLWQISLTSTLPVVSSKKDAAPALQHFYTGSVAVVGTGADSKGYRQQSVVRETPIGGLKDHSILHQLRSDTYPQADFSRWINVDIEQLLTSIDLNRDQRNSTHYSGNSTRMCLIDLPATWAVLYEKNNLDIEYLALTELTELLRIENELIGQALLQKSHATNDLKRLDSFASRVNRATTPPTLAISHKALTRFVEQKRKQFDRDHHLMRLTDLTLHLSPVDQDNGWAALKEIADARADHLGSGALCIEANRARFSCDISIIYEPATEIRPASTSDSISNSDGSGASSVASGFKTHNGINLHNYSSVSHGSNSDAGNYDSLFTSY